MDNLSDFSRIDEVVKNALGNFSETPSSNLWRKMKWKLFRRDLSNFFRFNKNSGVENVPLYKAVWFQISAVLVVSTAVIGTIIIVNNQDETLPATINRGSDLSNSRVLADNAYINQNNTVDNNINNYQNDIVTNYGNQNQNNPVIVANNNQTNNQTQTNQNDGSNIQNSDQSVNTNNDGSANNNQTVNDAQITDQNNGSDANVNNQNLPDDNAAIITDDGNNGVVDENDANFSNYMYNVEDEEFNLYIPNSFTPNGDGLNDYFIIANIEYCPQNMLMVTDRTGHIVYQRFDYQNDWDARDIPDDTYYYVFTYKSKTGKDVYKRGLLYIKRSF